jgi:hypothetical protein
MALDFGASPSPLLHASNLSFWNHVAHAGKWWCHSTTPGTSPFLPQLSLRHLRHIISSMVTGQPHPPPTQPDSIYPAPICLEGHLHLGGLLSPTDIGQPCLCPAVFSKTGWVSRFLTMHELGHCYDLPQCVIHSLSDKSIKDLSLSDLPFVRVAPTSYWHIGSHIEL